MADPENVPELETTPQAEDEPTSEEPSSQGDDAGQPAVLASQLMRDPMMLAALQDKLGSMVGGSSGYIQSLPKAVKRRIKALKKLQFEATKIEAEFYREVHRLECEYAAKYSPLFDKRSTVVTGEYEPNDEEADWPSDDEKDEDLAKGTDELASGDAKEEVKNKANIEDKKEENDEKKEEKDEDTKGIPGFWLTIFKNVDMLAEMIQPHDEPILNHLQEIKVEFKEKDPMGFTLEFFFDPNEYFENKKLTKEYVMRSEPEEGDPFSFEGPEIIKCHGCKIDWKKGKNVTVKTVKKKQKHKASGTTRTIQKTVQSDSFFNFFTPPSPPEDEEMDEDTEALLAADFEIGHFIRERIVPRAVLYFTGEALENDDDDDYGEEEEGAEEGEYDEDGDPDYNPGRGKYISREFQARCAALALGRMSTPSSAPCDTRLMQRPSSGSAVRRNIPTQTDISSRPQTAPPRSPRDSESVGSKPPVNTDAFSEKRPGTFALKDKPEKALIREGTEIFLPNALTAEEVVGGKPDKPNKISREKTFITKSDNRSVKPPGKMPREKCFINSPRRKSPPKPSRQFANKLGKETIDSEDECSESDEENACIAVETGQSSKQKSETITGKQKMPASSVGKVAGASKAKVVRKQENKPVNSATASAENRNTAGTRLKQEQRYGSVKSSGSYNRKDMSEKPSTKDAAFSILQKLTGKRSQEGHRPGQVPSVNKPRRKYKFTTPSSVNDTTDNQTSRDNQSNEQSVLANRGQQSASGKVFVKRQAPGEQKQKQAQAEPSREERKPASAPVRNTRLNTGTSGKFPVYESKNTVCRPKNVPVRESQSANPRVKPEKSLSAQQSGTQFQKGQSLKKTEAMPVKIPKEASQTFPNAKSQMKNEQNPKLNISAAHSAVSSSKQKTKGRTLVEKPEASSDGPEIVQKRGVRIQNAMISTSTEVSGSNVLVASEPEGGRVSVARSITPANLHPKLEGSPYLRENTLLASGKHRRRPGAGSAHSVARSTEQGPSGDSSETP